MPRGDKDKYTDKQKRQAEHIEEGYEKKGVSKETAEARAWATVNKITGGSKKPGGSGRGKKDDYKGTTESRKARAASRSEAAKKGWETRRKRAGK